MGDRSSRKIRKDVSKPSRRGNTARRKRADDLTLGLPAFEKISAVEGVRLTNEMRDDLRLFGTLFMDEEQRSRFIARKYGGA